MKVYLFFLLPLLACNQAPQNSQVKDTPLDSLAQHTVETTSTKQLIENYLSDLSSPDWERKLFKKYWWESSNEENYESFVRVHKKFRKAYTNYKVTIKHLVANGKDGVVWLRVSAVHSAKFDSDITRDTEATGKPVEWDEVWYYQVVDGKLGGEFELLSDEASKLRYLGIKCLPSEEK